MIFVSATLLGFASHSPGGLGVFDAAMLVALWEFDAEDLLAGLLMFRLLYYIVPFALALAVLGIREFRLHFREAAPMSATDDDGADQGWIGRLSRLLGRARGARMPRSPARAAERCRSATPPDIVLLDAVISGMPDPVVVLDQDGRVHRLQRRRPRRLRRRCAAASRPRSRCACPSWSRRSARASPTGKAQRIEFSDAVPSPRWSEAFVAPVALAAAPAAPASCVITLHDLTPIRRVEEMRADFVANVSHELRTPLAALSGFIDTLQGPARDDAAARERFLGIMQAQAERMARLIDDLLSLSRIELRAHQRPDTPVDLVPIVRQVVDGLQTLARDRDVAIEIDRAGRAADRAGRPRRTDRACSRT